MNLNPFAKKGPDDLQRTINAHRDTQVMQAAIAPSRDEQVVIEQQRERAELTKWQQDMSEDIKLLVHRLRNEVQDSSTNEWKRLQVTKPDGTIGDAKPLCAEECVWRIVGMLEPNISKNLMMSKYEKEYILENLRRLSDDLAVDILIPNRRKWNIEFSDLALIMDIFRSAATPTYFRALGANEKDYLKGIRKDTFLHTTDERAKKAKGFLGLT